MNLSNVIDRAWKAVLRIRVLTIGILVLAAVLVVTILSVADDDGGDLRDGSSMVAEAGAPVEVDSTPRTYRIVYRIENRGGGELVVRTEEVTVRRPFDGVVVDRAGEPPGDDVAATTVTRFGVLATSSPRAAPTVLNVPPNPPVADADPAAALEAARTLGMAELRERRLIEPIETQCQVYRVGGPIGGGSLVPLGAVEGEHADVCVDDRGLVLEEVDVVDGDRILRRRVAVAIDERPPIDDSTFALPDAEAPPADQGGGSVLEVDPSSRPPADPFFELPEPPEGFRFRGRYAVIPPQSEAFADPLQRDQRRAAVMDVYVDGPELIVVDQGGTLGRVQAFDDHPHGHDVEAGEVGDGQLILGFRTSEVRVARDAGRYVRVYGTVAPETLLEVIRSLEPGPGGGLVYLDEPEAA